MWVALALLSLSSATHAACSLTCAEDLCDLRECECYTRGKIHTPLGSEPNLVAHFPFTEGSGYSVVDVVNGLELVMSDAAAFAWVAGGQGIRTVGPEARLSSVVGGDGLITLRNSLRTANQMTADVWIRPSSVNSTGPARIFTLSASTSCSTQLFQFGQSSSRWSLRMAGGDDGFCTSYGGVVNEGTLLSDTLLTITFGLDGKQTVYANGVEVITRNFGPNWQPTMNWDNLELSFFNEVGLNRMFHGTIYSATIWNVAHTATAVRERYASMYPNTFDGATKCEKCYVPELYGGSFSSDKASPGDTLVVAATLDGYVCSGSGTCTADHFFDSDGECHAAPCHEGSLGTPPHCGTCDAPGFTGVSTWSVVEWTACAACSVGCKSCSGGACSVCYLGFYMFEGTCVECATGCVLLDGGGGSFVPCSGTSMFDESMCACDVGSFNPSPGTCQGCSCTDGFVSLDVCNGRGVSMAPCIECNVVTCPPGAFEIECSQTADMHCEECATINRGDGTGGYDCRTCLPNHFRGNSGMGPTFVKVEDIWKFEDSGSAGVGWNNLEFDDSSWGSGPGVLGSTGERATELETEVTTHYFRREFVVHGDPRHFAELVLLDFSYDDGVVVYLNGVEVFRDGFDGDLITEETTALPQQTLGTFVFGVENLLREGRNIISAETHQYSPDDSVDGGVVFGVRLAACEVWPLVRPRSVWKYVQDAAAPSDAWNMKEFNDSAWSSGIAPLGYPDVYPEVQTDLRGVDVVTRYFRHEFEVTSSMSFRSLSFPTFQYDDGVIVYLNGEELMRANMLSAGHFEVSSSDKDGHMYESFSDLLPDTLVDGTNVLAVELHQHVADSVDLILELALVGVPQNPKPAMCDACSACTLPDGVEKVCTASTDTVCGPACSLEQVGCLSHAPICSGPYATCETASEGYYIYEGIAKPCWPQGQGCMVHDTLCIALSESFSYLRCLQPAPQWTLTDGLAEPSVDCESACGGYCPRCGCQHFYGGKCYFVSTERVDFATAEAACVEMFNGHLVSIEDKEKRDFVIDASATFSVYTGLTDEAEEGTYTWNDGTTHGWYPIEWGAFEPNGETAENCVTFSPSAPGFIDVPCNFTYRYMCQEGAPTCDDGVRNGDELQIDCGGSTCPECELVCAVESCAFCTVADKCDLFCNVPLIMTATFTCEAECPAGQASDTSRADTAASGSRPCVYEHCINGVMDADEEEVDCGGSCRACVPTTSTTGGSSTTAAGTTTSTTSSTTAVAPTGDSASSGGGPAAVGLADAESTGSGGAPTVIIVVVIVVALCLVCVVVAVAVVVARSQQAKDNKMNSYLNSHDEDRTVKFTEGKNISGYLKTLVKSKEPFAHGGFGAVYKVEMPDGTMAALKVLESQAGDAQDEFHRELMVLSKFQQAFSQYVINMICCCEDADFKAIGMTFAKQNLREHLQGKAMKEKDITRIAARCGECLEHVHQHGLFHGDVKAQNFLVTGDSIVICDFGTSADMSPTGTCIGKCTQAATPHYMAPERYQWAILPADQGQQMLARLDLRKVDVYAFGIMLWSFCNEGQAPFPDVPVEDIARQMSEDASFRPQFSEGYDNLAFLAQRCWDADPHDRPLFKIICETLKAPGSILSCASMESANLASQ